MVVIVTTSGLPMGRSPPTLSGRSGRSFAVTGPLQGRFGLSSRGQPFRKAAHTWHSYGKSNPRRGWVIPKNKRDTHPPTTQSGGA